MLHLNDFCFIKQCFQQRLALHKTESVLNLMLQFYENLRLVSLAAVAPIVQLLSVFDARENDIGRGTAGDGAKDPGEGDAAQEAPADCGGPEGHEGEAEDAAHNRVRR